MELKAVATTHDFENWIHHFGDELFKWALFKTSSKEIAEDLVQETFLAAFHKLYTFQGKSTPKTWLFSILNHKIIDYYRASKKETKINFSRTETIGMEFYEGLFDENRHWKKMDVDPIWDDEEVILDNPEFANILKQCLDSLPEKWNLAVTSKYLSEKNAHEICQDLDISVTNYWQIIHRAKLLLKNCIELKWN
uniref:sigma-70 family RNA polymerase sigma factor n=1 Tax=Flavobacterium sp. TaxID=239 RepID=UPI004049B223